MMNSPAPSDWTQVIVPAFRVSAEAQDLVEKTGLC